MLQDNDECVFWQGRKCRENKDRQKGAMWGINPSFQRMSGVGSVLEEICVLLDKRRPFIGQFAFFKDGADGAFGFTGPTINALVRVDEQLQSFEVIEGFDFFATVVFFDRTVDAVNGTDFNANGVADTHAGFRNNVGHRTPPVWRNWCSLLPCCRKFGAWMDV
jgi:hypothetical protein